MLSLDWDKKGNPYNNLFNDCYFSLDDGYEESKYVFLEGNNLPKAWEDKEAFHVGECGFGTGLNLLALWELLLTCKAPPKKLYYYTFEGFPLLLMQLQKAHEAWPNLENLAQKLHGCYPKAPKNGLYELNFSPLHVKLVVGMAPEAIGLFHDSMDAWFLDGFAPSKNPQMWSNELFETIAKHSKTGATFATFTAASQVRRGMEAVGFNVKKRAGFGRKREMLCGDFINQGKTDGR